MWICRTIWLGILLCSASSAMALPEGKRTYVADPTVDAHKTTVADAIDRTAKTFNFLFRGFVRSKLRSINPVYDHIVMEYTEPTLTLSSGNLAMSLTGVNLIGHPHTTPKGIQVTVDQEIKEWTVRRKYNANNGYQEVLYTLDSELQTLTVEVSVGSRHFSTPMMYQLKYRLGPSTAEQQ